MNGLTLRITRAGTSKSKKSICFAPVEVESWDISGEKDDLFDKFIKSSSAEDQLKILNEILGGSIEPSSQLVKFLVVVFMQAEAKHPIKSFLARYITRNSYLPVPFSEALALHITTLVHKHSEYRQYVSPVCKLATCIENFPAGIAAIKKAEGTLMEYLMWCLDCCVTTLSTPTILAPTEKNEIFNLAHLALRLLLHIVQKVTHQSDKLTLMFEDIRLCVQHLMFDVDVPMDTKTVCGILYLTIHMHEFGADRWVDILAPHEDRLTKQLNNEAAQLALYSALATVVSMETLEARMVANESAVLVLTAKILDIGERSSSESIFILGVTRTLLQISKSLDKIADHDLGLRLMDSLLLYIWSHLEHYMDSVKHLTAQALGCVVRYCTRLKEEGNGKALAQLFSALTSLDPTRKSYYVALTSLAAQLGTELVLAELPDVICDVIAALALQPVQAGATTALEVLLQKHCLQTDTQTIYEQWVQPILRYVNTNPCHSGVLNILENLLAKAVKLDDNLMTFIIPHIQSCSTTKQDLKCILMLLSVAGKGNFAREPSATSEGQWKGIIDYRVLSMAAVDAVDETRILSLSLVVESPKTTEPFTAGDLAFVLRYLKYNINAQSPNFRQLTLSVMKKFVKRLEDSYKVLKRQNEPNASCNKLVFYLMFVEDLRQFCFDSLIPGANYSRRFVALQILVWCEQMQLDGFERIWRAEHVNTLLLHLEDSYESNKEFALEILHSCPIEIIRNNVYSTSLDFDEILKQASSLKPTDCVSAAYKFSLLLRKLPENIMEGEECSAPEPVALTALRRLLRQLRRELQQAAASVLVAARRAPMYGALHCLRRLMLWLGGGGLRAISNDLQWRELVEDIINTCFEVNDAVACVVNNSSPEGHLPMDMSGVVVTDDGNTGDVRLDDGRPVTAQMVLLFAWRSVKEVSLLLGTICSRLSIRGEGGEGGEAGAGGEGGEGGLLGAASLRAVGSHLAGLLAETKHRGAFEQAYVGFTCLLARLWRCQSAELHSLPRAWLEDLMATIAAGDRSGSLCATRRSAGLPYMIQALVTTEVQISSNPCSFRRCMASLLQLAGGRGEDTRTHCLNILRALFRNAALDEAVGPYVGLGLTVALRGFDGEGWAERNSSTLLFSALMVRIFGVQRSRDADSLCVRNRMTGRIFFLRYPHLYDFMLDKLKEASASADTQVLRPSLYPVLLLLARLYPSSLEGTVSNLKLESFIPHVLACGRSSVLLARQLAGRGVVALVAPLRYFPHIRSMLSLLQPETPRNYSHGILLQVSCLLRSPPEGLQASTEGPQVSLEGPLARSLWLLAQPGDTCYVLLDEYAMVLNFIVWRFPTLLKQDSVSLIVSRLEHLVFEEANDKVAPGRDLCLANILYLYLVMLHKYLDVQNIPQLVIKSLGHTSYEVVLSALNYLLIQHDSLDIDNKFHEHLKELKNENLRSMFKNHKQYIQALCNVLNNKYPECRQKCLKILVLERDTQMYITNVREDGDIIKKLFVLIDNAHENLTHIYLESLGDFISKKLKESSFCGYTLLNVIRTMFACSSSDNSHCTRSVVVGFLEDNFDILLHRPGHGLGDDDKFEYKSTLWSTSITLLEDDDIDIRQRMANKLVSTLGQRIGAEGQSIADDLENAWECHCGPIIPSLCGELVRDYIEGDEDCVALYALLALVDFRSEVCITDDVGDECRVFDQNERYNIFLEEAVWSDKCADKIISIHQRDKIQDKPIDHIPRLISTPRYARTFDILCNNNYSHFEAMVNGSGVTNGVVNPKIELFINRLRNV